MRERIVMLSMTVWKLLIWKYVHIHIIIYLQKTDVARYFFLQTEEIWNGKKQQTRAKKGLDIGKPCLFVNICVGNWMDRCKCCVRLKTGRFKRSIPSVINIQKKMKESWEWIRENRFSGKKNFGHFICLLTWHDHTHKTRIFWPMRWWCWC